MKKVLMVGVLGCFFLALAGTGYGSDSSKVPNANKFPMENDIMILSTSGGDPGGLGYEVRRPDHLASDTRASVACWVPLREPPPLKRTRDCFFEGSAKIFLNVNATTRANYPFLVKNGDVWYAYRNVRYHWKFEKTDKATGEPHGGNTEGVSGYSPWSPFLRWEAIKGRNGEALQVVLAQAEKAGPVENTTSEPKLFFNRHTSTYDSGIDGNTQVAESSILQKVTMTLTYDAATVTAYVQNIVGNGYPEGPRGTADSSNTPPTTLITSKAELTEEPYYPSKDAQGNLIIDSSVNKPYWITKVAPQNRPAGFENVDWGDMGEASSYALAYVEDYKGPDGEPIEPEEGDNFTGQTRGHLDRDLKIDYEDDNENANIKSDQLTAKFKFFLGNADIYKLENPYYQADNPNTPYYLYVFYLAGNGRFGPYVCAANKGSEGTYYAMHHPYWKTKTPEERDDYIAKRYENVPLGSGIPSWHVGVIFATLPGPDLLTCDSKLHTLQLNDAWYHNNLATATCIQTARANLSGAPNQAAAQRALAGLADLERVIGGDFSQIVVKSGENGPSRQFYRFAPGGYAELEGSYCFGPQALEKDNPEVHKEWPAEKEGVAIKKGWWRMHKDRILMPAHYSTCAVDMCRTSAFTSKQVLNVVVANCCGQMTTVTPEFENEGDMIKIEDTGDGSKPIPEVNVRDPRTGVDTPCTVPCGDEMAVNTKLVVEPKPGVSPLTPAGPFRPNEYNEECDFSKYNYFLQKTDGTKTPIKLFAETAADLQDPVMKDKAVYEDVRLAIQVGGYDNIDILTPFRGIGKTLTKIQKVNDNGTLGELETLEYTDESGSVQKSTEILRQINDAGLDPKSHAAMAAAYAFSPKYTFYHVFRQPGLYRVLHTVWEHRNTDTSGAKKSRTLAFDIRVFDLKSQARTLEDNRTRQQ